MKDFDIEKIEESLKTLEEVTEELRIEISKKQAYYAKICGYNRHSMHDFSIGKFSFKKDKIIKYYKIIRADLKSRGEHQERKNND